MSLTLIELTKRDAISHNIENYRLVNDYFLEQLESDIEAITKGQLELVNDHDIEWLLTRYAESSPYQIYEKSLNVEKRLMFLKNTLPLIQSVDVVLHQSQFVLSTDRLINDIHKKYDSFQGILSIESPVLYPITQQNDALYIKSNFPNEKLSKELYEFTSITTLSKDEMISRLKDLSLNEKNNAIIISLEDNWFLTNDRQAEGFSQVYQDVMKHNLSQGHPQGSFITDNNQVVVYEKSDYLNLLLVTYFPDNMLAETTQKFVKWQWFITLGLLVAVVIFVFYLRKQLSIPLGILVKAFSAVEEEGLDNPIDLQQKDEFGFVFARFNRMIIKLKQSNEIIYEQEILMQKMQLNQLQLQINPHFLYNSLFTISRMASDGNTSSIIDFANFLGEYYRFITKDGFKEKEVPLIDEVRHAKNYIRIQRIRFRDRVKVTFEEVPASIIHYLVPRIIIQPVIENAYKYCFSKMEEGGILDISFDVKQDSISIHIEDNGSSSMKNIKMLNALFSSKDIPRDSALFNIDRRLKIKFGEHSGLEVSQSKYKGTKFTIKIMR
ncbi:histidine kinase [Vallitalea pronyensis]|uniref:Histidine kinase n=1 Tax=Vallitalea pronyensis TaxID=1348613 RepID=A0A8J8MG44_9FIRM|nr:histidine kinase [Vallitalea pronyensis]QUI21020.1 histidine kinase [Vallitalea pronyensis]